MKGWKLWVVIGVAALAAGVVGGPLVYKTLISGDAPERLSLGSAAPSGGVAVDTDGEWKVASGSVVGYRVKEVLFGQNNDAVGRTDDVTGSITVEGTRITSGSFTAQMATVTSDQERRDNQFRGRIMNVATYPTATFKLTGPIDVGSVPEPGQEVTRTVTGDLTMHGVTKAVEFKATGRLEAAQIKVTGSVPVKFSDWTIPNPSFGPVTTEDHGEMEFSLNFTKA